MRESRAWGIPVIESSEGASSPLLFRTPFIVALRELSGPIEVPQARSGELRGLDFFVHRDMQHGRERHTLCLGFFARREDAERKLPVLRDAWPDACVRSIRDQAQEQGPHPGTELSDVEVIRVLEARPRAQFDEPREVAVATPRSVVRELSLPTRAPQVPEPKPAAAFRSTPAPQSPPAPKPPKEEERDSLAETLNELRKFAFDLESDDDGSTTGVRHLEVEFDESASSRKSRGPRR